MARTYKRDKNGRFSGGGSSSTGSTGRSVANSRSRSSRLGLESTGNKTRATRDSEIFGSKRRGNKVTGTTIRDSTSNAGGRLNGAKDAVRTKREGSYLYGANKVRGAKVVRNRGK